MAFTPLRATAATNALDHSADIAKVQEWLGHANISTTRIDIALQTPKKSHPTGDFNNSVKTEADESNASGEKATNQSGSGLDTVPGDSDVFQPPSSPHHKRAINWEGGLYPSILSWAKK